MSSSNTSQPGSILDVREVLDGMTGEICWSIKAGKGTGTHVSVDVGAKVRRRMRIPNPSLTAEQREFKGECGFIVYSAWRLDGLEEVVGGCWESNEKDGPMLTTLAQLVGRRIEGYELRGPALDLDLHLEGGLIFRIFCDQTDLEEDQNSYSVWKQLKLVSVGPRTKIETMLRRS